MENCIKINKDKKLKVLKREQINMEKDKLTAAQRDYRRQMMLTDEDYYNEHKNDPECNEFINYNESKKKKFWILISIFIVVLIFVFIKFENNDNKKFNLMDKTPKNQEYIFNYLSEYNPEEILITFNAFVDRLDKEDFNLIKTEIQNELIYINTVYKKLNVYQPKDIISNLHNLNLLKIKQLKYTYEVIINSNELNPDIYIELMTLETKYNEFRTELINTLEKSNFEYTIHNDGSITYTYQKIKF